MRAKRTQLLVSVPAGIAAGSCLSMAVTLLGSLVTALLLDGSQIEMSNAGYCIMTVTLVSAAAGCAASIKLVGRLKLPVGLGSAVTYFTLLICVTALFFGGQFQGVGVTALLILGGAISVLLVSIRGKRRPGVLSKKK